jgi:hypothetical protein
MSVEIHIYTENVKWLRYDLRNRYVSVDSGRIGSTVQLVAKLNREMELLAERESDIKAKLHWGAPRHIADPVNLWRYSARRKVGPDYDVPDEQQMTRIMGKLRFEFY